MPIKLEMTCPTCGAHDLSKNGTTPRGKQNDKCRDCGRQFVEDPQWKAKDKNTFRLVDLLLLHVEAADIAPSKKNAVILEKAGEPHRCNLVVYSRIQLCHSR